MRKTLRMTVLAGGALAALGGAMLLAKPEEPERSPYKLKVPVTYGFTQFEPKRGWPRYDTAYLRIAAAAKPRPLYVTGKGAEGEMKVAFQDLGKAESIIDNPNVAKFIDLAETTGSFTVRLSHYHVSPPEADRTVGTAWLAGERPEIILKVDELAAWSFVLEGNKPVHETYNATLKGSLAAAGTTTALEEPVVVRFVDVGRDGLGKPPRMIVTGDWKIESRALGLEGADAGPLRVSVRMEGYTNFLTDQVNPTEMLDTMEMPTVD